MTTTKTSFPGTIVSRFKREQPPTDRYIKTQRKLAEVEDLHNEVQGHQLYSEEVDEEITRNRSKRISSFKETNEKLLKAEQSLPLFRAEKARAKIAATGNLLTEDIGDTKGEVTATKNRLARKAESLEHPAPPMPTVNSFEFAHGRIQYESQRPTAGGYALVQKGIFFPIDKPETPCVVALKLNLPDKSKRLDEKAELAHRLKRARREANTWQQLHHDNIAEFFYTIPVPEESPEMIFIVSPWSDGCGTGSATASEFLRDGNFAETTPTIIAGLIAGMRYMHDDTTKPSVWHGDLKGNNILIFGGRHAPVAKITDFGLSKMEAPDASAPSVVGGAVHWAPPELFRSEDTEPVTSREADVWSVGMTVFELVTGRPPLSDKTQSRVVFFYINETPESVEQELKDYLLCLPVTLRAFVQHLIVFDPAQRPDMNDVESAWSELVPVIARDHGSWANMMETVNHPHRLHNRLTNPNGEQDVWTQWMSDQRDKRRPAPRKSL
ncbi:kinase-like protein [Sistotremastrum niveocremeum HHB9708]|uniref:Kinase-like protein n=1 Tax=Sistotremastrum niveocremeum HHB9708 TaxID=1314777 RepID=A0A164QMW9_9AGAM|nr:kinase-like protein [Sistotremastrum niveocremeum HHB9708]